MKQSLNLKSSGSLVNFLMGNNNTIPKVGEGATVLLYSDRHAYEVIEFNEKEKSCVIQRYQPERIDTQDFQTESQEYKYEKLVDYKEKLVWRYNSWRKVVEEIVFVKGFDRDSYNGNRNDLYDENYHLKLIDGITEIKTNYYKINIIFGVKQEYYDFTK